MMRLGFVSKNLQLLLIFGLNWISIPQNSVAQIGVGINSNGAPPHDKAILDVSIQTKGVWSSRMDTAARMVIAKYPSTTLQSSFYGLFSTNPKTGTSTANLLIMEFC